MVHWQQRFKAAFIHLGISLFVAALAAALVFWLWYPYPYRDISGGRELFTLLVSVDVILGPLLTFAVFNRTKPRAELVRDLGVIGLLQISALLYGMWTVFEARPVHLVFEIDRFRVIHAVEVPIELLPRTPSGVEALPLTGPTMLAVRPFVNENEKMQATLAALKGIPLSGRPDLWRDYPSARPQVLAAAKPLAALKQRFPNEAAAIDQAVKSGGGQPDTAVYLPLTGRKSFWTAFIDPVSANVIGFLPIDSF